MSNYKLEVENTEKLKNDINSAFTEINNEIKKDDALIANDLFDVDRCIEELKKSRKKWASGSGGATISNNRITIDISRISFKPTVLLCVMTNSSYTKTLKCVPLIDSENHYIVPQYDDDRIWELYNFSFRENKDYLDDLKNIMVVYSKNHADELAKEFKWYAFE